jgi:hypothetical protein
MAGEYVSEGKGLPLKCALHPTLLRLVTWRVQCLSQQRILFPTMSAQPANTTPCLIQLNGDNVVANLLPIMALKPERILQIVTKSQRAERAVSRFKEVFSLLAGEKGYQGYKPRIHDHNVSSGDMGEIRDTVARLLLENPGAVVNFSSGSRLMSLGAYQAALALGRPSIFCDVDDERFVSGRTAPMASPADYKGLVAGFSIGLLMAVQGRRFEDWKAETPSEALQNFGLKAYELRNQQWGPLENFSKAFRAAVYGPTDRLPDSHEELSTLLAKPLPSSVTSSEPARQYLSAATSAGLLKSQGPETFKLAVSANKREIADAVHVITQGWLELAVLDRLLRHPGYQQLMWRPQTSGDSGPASGIFGIETQGMKLRYIECVGALSKSPQDHLETLTQKARQLGGAAAEATLVVLKTQNQDSSLRHAAKRLGVEIVIGAEEIVKRFVK